MEHQVNPAQSHWDCPPDCDYRDLQILADSLDALGSVDPAPAVLFVVVVVAAVAAVVVY